MDYRMLSSDEHTTAEAGASRGARRERKRERTRGEGCQPIEAHAALPPQSGRTRHSTQPCKPETVEDALRLEAGAALQRAVGQSMIREGDRFDGLQELVDAAGMETAAVAFLDPRNPGNNYMPSTLAPGNGGEMVLLKPEEVSDVPRFVDTVRESPDVLTARASRTRLELASKAGVLDLGVDLAQTIKARNSFEKMIAHQLAALHCLAMNAVARADDLTKLHKSFPGDQTYSIEANRNATTAARLVTTMIDGYVALDRVRRGGRQTIKVIQQVAVSNGGRAAVAGSVKTGGHRRKPKTQRERTQK
jgi:hypothetical protein